MRAKFAASVTALLLVAATAAAQGAGKVSMQDFSGTWVLDPAKSQGGMGGPGGGQQGPAEETMTVAREGDKLTVERKIKGQQGERTVNDVITADGKEGDFTMQMRGGNEAKGKRTAKLSADGTALEVNDKATVETPNGPATFESSSKWTLSDGGKTLTIDQTRTTPRGPMTSKRVYAKK
jgi:hypothetical protein